jgi:hypothetical protein
MINMDIAELNRINKHQFIPKKSNLSTMEQVVTKLQQHGKSAEIIKRNSYMKESCIDEASFQFEHCDHVK